MLNSDSSLVFEKSPGYFYSNKTWDDFGQLLARIDESTGYDVDVTEIWKKDAKYFLLTATGCSCWGGEYETREFDSLEDIEKGIRGEDSDKYMYNPSYLGLTLLMEDARANDR